MPSKKESYESMIKELEKIVSSMENEELPLEEAMKNYEDGVKLCDKLYKILNKAEGKIKLLTENGEEEFKKAGDSYEQ
ncbi:exodeoxyribonuclease VII small subunit [Clostridium acetobutylicum]|uniref:Exodeoxyribonuclease 7 small subunit n=1 Tax=Clostridium acetobutylicum (strain ATCC 824 / DSM 792 / JCM 1419 / IAM 19013 / LMG 5710 / NBRC 13948 / NRRL B-527 / VKM B-1787 / 2291 / W) TaxID=272562 RepID=EX7S_CLOAB|nr:MULTISPECIES: exodeoxyribonuclease VII small subunit [Clostridium]Q97HD1.1 RecName: Full=Exodeoxyribonuclease 7 small subunit; AltName: Full=Exodeoxyribonuclease VII small subunit; Short=Exonuclease VII small subunit [Clostridium acetobutylicum ATCC 824]AAK80040.1 Exonuclease VII small subunit [Clostridium acetobutylicum ATCC 824]ADZ21132.1 exodeoxyribonuclease VII small subunit [Clostridium acetobutylicum EA 2018]AEI33506.1 exodeoxyribonuclease VII small subunit [Clostridium acetobutylicum 